SGSIEFQPPSKYYQDKLYKNDGRGNFVLDAQALPPISASGSCVRAADFDGDNDLDLFVGGRVVPGSYPMAAESYLLKNEKGKFTNVTASNCPDLVNLGMVTDALFTDFDNDNNIDLVVVGEFMHITFFKNSAGKFSKVSDTGLEEFSGWWNSVVAGDFDNDGDIDYVAGNLGLNNGYQANKEFPISVYANDFDKNGSVDAILACYIKESLKNDEKKLYPVHFWDEINSQSPRFRQQFNRYKHYGKAPLNGLLTPEEVKGAYTLQANHFETSYIENLGNGKFKLTALPQLVQVSPVNGMITDDVNGDGNLDVIMVGNDFGNEVFFGRYDAFTGLVLLGNCKGSFEIVPSAKSGFLVNGDAKGFARLSGVKGDVYIATQNRDSVKVFEKTIENNKATEFQPAPLDTWAELTYKDGKKSRVEFYYGAGYLSQSTRRFRVPKDAKDISVHNAHGESRKISPGI
ncbi:MAG TPA: VCBS repeat-containing protein, partial [Cyclobacteriaceae bacterium]|nr:VCBS repeat-containing protein [Cyclobacteriaceae bacterium]